MIWDHIEKLRECIRGDNWPLPYDQWPEELNDDTNCLAFALGLTKVDCDYDSFVSWNPEFPKPKFSAVFERLLNELGFEWRNLENPEKANSDEFIIQIYGFYKFPFLNDTLLDFHVIRRELDGTWIHKPSFNDSPCKIDFEVFHEEYPDNEIAGIYAVRKPQ